MTVRKQILTLLFVVGWFVSLLAIPPISAIAQGAEEQCSLYLGGGKWTETEQLTVRDCVGKVAAQHKDFVRDSHFGLWGSLLIRVDQTGEVYVDVAMKAETPKWIHMLTIELPGADRSGSDAAVEAIKRILSGKKVVFSWRKGAGLYGTRYFNWIDYCGSNYNMLGQSYRYRPLQDEDLLFNRKQTGYWNVIRAQDQVEIHHQATSGGKYIVPVEITNDGGLVTRNGVNITFKGEATC